MKNITQEDIPGAKHVSSSYPAPNPYDPTLIILYASTLALAFAGSGAWVAVGLVFAMFFSALMTLWAWESSKLNPILKTITILSYLVLNISAFNVAGFSVDWILASLVLIGLAYVIALHDFLNSRNTTQANKQNRLLSGPVVTTTFIALLISVCTASALGHAVNLPLAMIFLATLYVLAMFPSAATQIRRQLKSSPEEGISFLPLTLIFPATFVALASQNSVLPENIAIHFLVAASICLLTLTCEALELAAQEQEPSSQPQSNTETGAKLLSQHSPLVTATATTGLAFADTGACDALGFEVDWVAATTFISVGGLVLWLVLLACNNPEPKNDYSPLNFSASHQR